MRSSERAEDSRLLGERDTLRPGAAALGTRRSDLEKGHPGLEVWGTELRSNLAKETTETRTVPSRTWSQNDAGRRGRGGISHQQATSAFERTKAQASLRNT